MPRRGESWAGITPTTQWNGAGTMYLVQTPAGVLYNIWVDSASDAVFSKSTDGGLTWNTPTVLLTGTVTNLAVWYDRWSGINAGLIHVAYTDSGDSDTKYRTIDTENSDTLNTQTVIFAGTSRANGGNLSIARAKGGNVYCKTMIDAGAEGGFFRLPNANVPSGAWDAARTVDETLATTDQNILLPDMTAADTQDMIMLFWDASANEISRKLYDDSANSWSETSIATSMADDVATNAFPHFAAAVDLTNSRIVMVAWSGVDTANADLRCWTITNSAITETSTNVVLNSTDDQGLCGISIDSSSGEWNVAYAGKSDGSETWPTAVNMYTKGSRDGGATWGPETKLTALTTAPSIRQIYGVPWRYQIPPIWAWFNDLPNADILTINVDVVQPRGLYQLGV